jgi:ATP-dependent Clp protease ATP-binding subunit ClpA
VRLLARLAVTPDAVERTLTSWPGSGPPPQKIDAQALAALGIDLEAVREQLEQIFGPGALEQTQAACLATAPRLKLALAYALDLAAGDPLDDDHVLLGILTVPDSVAARVLEQLGVTFGAARAITAIDARAVLLPRRGGQLDRTGSVSPPCADSASDR